MHRYMDACMYGCMHVRMRACMYVCMSVGVHTFISMCTYIYRCDKNTLVHGPRTSSNNKLDKQPGASEQLNVRHDQQHIIGVVKGVSGLG